MAHETVGPWAQTYKRPQPAQLGANKTGAQHLYYFFSKGNNMKYLHIIHICFYYELLFENFL